MKNYLFALICLCLMSNVTMAQHIAFKKLYSTTGPSNQGSGIIQQANGDYIISGIRSVPYTTGQYLANIYLMRINSVGDAVWTKEIGTNTDRELAYGMTQLPNGNIIITGSINLPPSGLSDALIVCTDSNGNLIWQKRYGGSMTDQATSAVFDGKDIIVSGITESYGAGDADAWLLKLNTAGDTIWTKTYGGTAFDDAWGVVAAHGAYYITGGTYSFADGLYDDAWVVKIDTAGNKLWHKAYGEKDRVDWAWSIAPVTTSGAVTGFVLTGIKDTEENQPGNARGDMHFVKIDTSGAVVWDKSIGGTGGANWRREGYDLKQMPDEGFVICGYKLEPSVQSQQMYVVRTDKNGVVLWDTAFGTSDSNYYANAITVTNDGGWAITGSVFHTAQQIRYIYVTKFNPGGVNIEDVVSDADVVVYPNPTYGAMHIRANGNINIDRVAISGIDGKLIDVYSNERAGAAHITIGTQPQGVYLLEISTNKGVVRKKIVSIR